MLKSRLDFRSPSFLPPRSSHLIYSVNDDTFPKNGKLPRISRTNGEAKQVSIQQNHISLTTTCTPMCVHGQAEKLEVVNWGK